MGAEPPLRRLCTPCETCYMNNRAITVLKAAEICRVSPDTVRRWVDKGVLPAYRLPSGHRRLDIDQVLQFQRELMGSLSKEVNSAHSK